MDWVRDERAGREFEGFVAGATAGLFRTAYLMTGDAGDAEDAVQESLIRVARRWRRVRVMERPAAYARRILVGVILDGAARRSRQRAELAPPGDHAPDPADDRAARALRDVDDLAEFQWALARLSPRQRAVLILRYWEDLPVAEVATLLRCSEATVTSTACRGTARLAQALATGAGAARAAPAPARRPVVIRAAGQPAVALSGKGGAR
jgi:RNA polymerase sigma-70 factor (sigma-E family)